MQGIPGISATFDYIVIGGGTGGITLASRLALNNFRVALIEAGDYYEMKSLANIPGAVDIGVGSDPHQTTLIDWGFVAKQVPGANGRDIHYPRGKCLGGSSALNFMIYQRPTKGTMEMWADQVNDSSYSFENVMPFFKKTVQFTPPNAVTRFANASARYKPDAFDPAGGPLHVSYSNYAQPFSTWMDRGVIAVGIKRTEDFNSGTLFGAQYCSSTIRPSDQTRSSSERAFLKSSLPLGRLTIYKNTMARKIIFNKYKKATKVRVSSFLLQFTLYAAREVIISAGAFQSPQLLMLSGIGPADILHQHGIDVVSELPGVGQNMWDHVFFGPTYRVNVETLTKLANDVPYLAEQLLKYEATHTGPLTNPVADYLAWEKLPNTSRSRFSSETERELSKFPSDWPEVEYVSGSGYVGNYSNLLTTQPRDGYQYATILGTLVAPTSRGNVTIASADPSHLPIINPNWLATRADQEVAVATYKRVREIFHSEGMSPVVIGDEYFPGSRHSTDEEILEVIKNTVMTIYHASCTCKMGIKDDLMAVVDSKARVFGVQGLRVVDASAFPLLVPGHPQSVVCKFFHSRDHKLQVLFFLMCDFVDMLAEKIAADIITSS
ncbi:hypothetical protein ASPZODRAFT_97904 [Penicilliopsis zonata CBS 506.65]|uniref:Glucose-methanol-choline oxidoreductase N-terminal domain-containing protein n=1 Tax=Penicilliopsis zonata CBS 506.65 TaxID=1073090 RepID=A0A1L9SG12_9EURO|nr:hypothetical protein ASPZODRAFT_97904 [Penicilliopsis zonata CBS 506.65]OJJ46215.1 hypothetical protein ASPZODRAFT_97904 [Penicilliopsis zonata CBS 506.65]